MAWEWVAPVATASTAIVGMTVTWCTARSGQVHARQLAKDRMDHEISAALEDRHQQRLADTYVELLTLAESVGHWASAVRPMLDTGSPPPPLPPLAEQARVEARVRAFGSEAVLHAQQAWRMSVQKIIKVDEDLRYHETITTKGHKSSIDDARLLADLPDLRERELQARKEMSDLVACELKARPLQPRDNDTSAIEQ